MATLIDFVLPAVKRAADRHREFLLSPEYLSHPENTGVVPPRWSCSDHKERIDQIAAVVSRMQGWMNEAAIIEATSNLKPVGAKEIARFMKLKDTLETYVNLFEEIELPDGARSQSKG
jgi:hypothetical protein